MLPSTLSCVIHPSLSHPFLHTCFLATTCTSLRYFALIIRAIGVLEGIALVGDPDFALVDEAYPYISKRLLTDKSPRLRAALTYMVYGKSNVFDAERLIDILESYEEYAQSSQRNGGASGVAGALPARSSAGAGAGVGGGAEHAAAPSGAGQRLLPVRLVLLVSVYSRPSLRRRSLRRAVPHVWGASGQLICVVF